MEKSFGHSMNASETLGIKNSKVLFIGLGALGAEILTELQKIIPDRTPVLYIDTDGKALSKSTIEPTLLIGSRLLGGRSAAGGSAFGKKAVIESISEIMARVAGFKKICIISSLTGGTGSAAPLLAQHLTRKQHDACVALCDGLMISSKSKQMLEEAMKLEVELNHLFVYSQSMGAAKSDMGFFAYLDEYHKKTALDILEKVSVWPVR